MPSFPASLPVAASLPMVLLPPEEGPAALVSKALCMSTFFKMQRPTNPVTTFEHGGMKEDFKTVPFKREPVSPNDSPETWWRIPIHHSPQPVLPVAERTSRYADKDFVDPMVCFHRVSWTILTAQGRSVQDWNDSNRPVHYPSNIIAEGRMRNGINDSNHRGVWLHLGFAHPYPAERDEIQVELDVVQSSIHKGKNKWHWKYCAVDSPPGEWNAWTRVRALHVPSRFLTHEFKEMLR